MSDKAALAAAVAVVVDVAAIGWILLRGGRSRVGRGRLGASAVVAALLFGLQAACALLVGARFLVITFAWALLAIALPIVAAWVLLVSRARPVDVLVRAFAWASLASIPVSLHSSFVAPYQLVVERVDIAVRPGHEPPRPLRIAVLADIQCVEVTPREHEAIRLAMQELPDLVLLPGDFVQVGSQRVHEIAPAFRDLVRPLTAPLGVFAVHGDTDTLADARELVAGTHVRVLDDEVARVEHAGVWVALAGISLDYRSASARRALRELEATEGSLVKLVVAHRPDVVLQLSPGSDVDLVVAGHTHGGQVVLPFLGALYTSTALDGEVGAGGLHSVGGHELYISRGIGWEHGHAPRIRLACPPEVSVLTLLPRGIR